jgi:hypothetical protein
MLETRAVSPLRGVAATLALCLAAHGAAQGDALPVRSIDLYGSAALDSPDVLAQIEPEIARLAASIATAMSDPGAADERAIDATEADVEAKVKAILGARAPLAHVAVSAVTSFSPPPPYMTFTIDVVEQADAARRMPFRAAPTAQLADPGGVLAIWAKYQDKVFELAYAGTPLQVGFADCPALHCVAPFDIPELAPYLARFDAGAREHEAELYAVAEQSANAEQRGNALFVLAHTDDAERLLPALSRAIYDPAEGVRNNAMRVLMFMAQSGRELDYPLDALLAAFDFPSTSDRNKSAGRWWRWPVRRAIATRFARPPYRLRFGC